MKCKQKLNANKCIFYNKRLIIFVKFKNNLRLVVSMNFFPEDLRNILNNVQFSDLR